jgi:flavin reductase (DIM6/NTAB) family NADH-FMN oxidoreductase RutF
MTDEDRAAVQTVSDTRSFRQALGCFPTGVTIVTTADSSGIPAGLTCNSFGSVSLEPPLITWSLRATSRSAAVFRRARAFAVNVLAETQNPLAMRFADSSIPDKFDTVPTRRGLRNIPLIEDCVAYFECVTCTELDVGDHVLFIGNVERFSYRGQHTPLVFCKGNYGLSAAWR